MTTVLFNLVLLALAMDLIIWGIDQGWRLVNRYRDHKEITYDHILQGWLKLQQAETPNQSQEINKWGQRKPKDKTNVVPMWHHQHGGGDSDGHA